MKRILLSSLSVISLLTFSCFIFFTFQPQSTNTIFLIDSAKKESKERLILVDPNCLERLSLNLECKFPIRIASSILSAEIENKTFGAFKGKIQLDFHLDEQRGKDFWLFRPTNSNSLDGQRATKKFSTVPFSTFPAQIGQLPLEVPIPIKSFTKSWKRGKFFECGDGNGYPLLRRKDGQTQVIPLDFMKRLAEFMDVLETQNATGILMGGTLLGWRRECSIIPHTHDIDLGILREEHSEGLVRALIKHRRFDGAYLLGHLSESLILKFDVDGVRIDLFYVYPHPEKGDKSYVAGFRNDNRQLLFWVYPQIREFCAGEMLGHLFHFPCNFDDFIISDYGPEWRVDFPSSNFIWDQSHKNIESREIRSPEEWAKTSIPIDRRWKFNEAILNKGLKQMGII